MTLVYLGFGWLAGFILAHFFPLKWPVWLILSVLPLAAALIQRDSRPHRRFYSALLFLFLGAGRYRLEASQHFGPADLAYYNDANWGAFEGYIADQPDPRADHTKLTVQVEQMQLNEESAHAVSGRVLLEAPRYPSFRYGDRLRFSGRPQTPAEDEDFSYRDHLARQRIYSIVQQPYLEPLPGRAGSPLKQALFDLKAKAQSIVKQLLPDPEASLLSGILLGNEQGIPNSLLEAFADTGTAHIIAISGFNISIIVQLLHSGLGRIAGRRRAGPLALGFVILYTILVGADATVVRAAVMGSLMVVGRMLGRRSFGPASLTAAGLVMTAVQPLLISDIGFQLSFAATLGLMLYGQPVNKHVRGWLRRKNGPPVIQLAAELLLITAAAQLATTPIILFHFARFSSVALLANLLILWAQPIIMIVGGLATVAGLFWLALGQIIALGACFPLLILTIRVVEWTASIPHAAFDWPIPLGGLLILVLLQIGSAWLLARPGRPRQFLRKLTAAPWVTISLLALVIGMILAANIVQSLPDGRLHVTFLDVGEGEAILLQTPSGRTVLIDGGPDPAVLADHLGRRLPFWHRNLDLLIITHPDSQHLNALPDIVDRYPVGALITNGQIDGPPSWVELLEKTNAGGAAQVTAVRGQTVKMGDGVSLEILHPGRRLGEREDDNSVVVRVVYNTVSFLLTGDIEKETETALIDAGLSLQSTVLKAADGGDRDGTGQEFLAAVRPWATVFSVGGDNPHRHPNVRVLQRVQDFGCGHGRTDQLGSIHFITDGKRLWVENERP